MRLVGEPGLARHVGQWSLCVDSLAREAEPAHEQVAVRVRAEHGSELAGEVVARQSRDRLELRRMHDARSLRVEELTGALDGGDVDSG
ncbi:MAG: hypothetical protein DME05_21235 [Candidatus Rokuibacteriota bacterium]|nr:MAG: hypothetical protein DME05_21235 [Candidatus Rokubacteria bacterium]